MSDPSVLRLAMWSGPRNISTALMRSWGNRPDTFVCDEPFYAYYLHASGRRHPVDEKVIAAGPTDWHDVVARITGDPPAGQPIFLQKHMAQHLLPEVDRGWLDQLTHWFLIRDPREMLTSFLKHVPDATLPDTGLPQQVEIFELMRARTGETPAVLDSRDVLTDPCRMLTQLCERLGVAFSEQMLSWPPGFRDTDGVWARHWYGEVIKTTSFRPYQPKPDQVPDEFAELQRQCEEFYQQLYQHRLRP